MMTLIYIQTLSKYLRDEERGPLFYMRLVSSTLLTLRSIYLL